MGAKNGTPATHPLDGEELRALRRLQRESEPSDYVFATERGAPFAVRGFQAMLERAGKAVRFQFKVHPHMLRHACGFKLAGRRRYPSNPGVFGASLDPAHGEIHGIIAGAVQGFSLEGLTQHRRWLGLLAQRGTATDGIL
jgi:hypothetical protein